ncbi:MAG TPA: DUF4054 domain-containing protein [Stenotrophobium sp.]|nr:DUF4054 domain-containing protein [Stenotrophobium sp.]
MIASGDLRANFPEFANTAAYPDGQVQFWLTLAYTVLNPDAWADYLDLGAQLYTAHHLVIGARDQKSAAAGGVPGAVTGPQASKAVDKVSVSYNTGAVTLEGGGFWNATMYGIQFYQLARVVGAGGVQL